MEKFDATSRFLHWLSALVILWASISGLYATTLNEESELKHQIGYFNVSITTLFIPFFAWRLIHCWRRNTPTEPSDLPSWNQTAAHLVHQLIYATTAIVLISGVFMMNREIEVFSILSFQNPINDGFFIHLFEIIHSVGSQFLTAIVTLHIAAVAKHQLAGRPILKRMI